MTVGREHIANVVRALNLAENDLTKTARERAAGFWKHMSESVRVCSDGQIVTLEDGSFPTLEDAITNDSELWVNFPDYQRTFERVIIEPPFVAIGWTITLTAAGTKFTRTGQNQYEFGEDGKIIRSWLGPDHGGGVNRSMDSKKDLLSRVYGQTESDLIRYVGVFKSSEHDAVGSVRRVGACLYWFGVSGAITQLIPTGEHRFELLDYVGELDFELIDGQVSQLTSRGQGESQTMIRSD